MASPGGLPLRKQVEEATEVSQPRKWAQQEEQEVGEGKVSETLPRLPTRACAPALMCPVLGGGPAMVSGHGQVPEQEMLPAPAPPPTGTSSPSQGSFFPPPPPHQPLPRLSSLSPGAPPSCHHSWLLPTHSPHGLEPPGLSLTLEKARMPQPAPGLCPP